jgi:orotate phosphoribosyltransferase
MEKKNKLKKLFEQNGALLSGHFKLSSGYHSDMYFQSALILQYSKKTMCLAKELANKIKNNDINPDVIVSPAIGGIIIGYEMARILKVRAIFTERVDGRVLLRRGFSVRKGEKILVVEDVITTGLSSKEVIDYLKISPVKIVGIAALVDRSAGKVNFGLPMFSLLSIEVKNYEENKCPMCKKGDKILKPGSRK